METIQEHLQRTSGEGYAKRVSLQRSVERLSKSVARKASRLIWAGRLSHMRHFNHDFSFTRSGPVLSSMKFKGADVIASLPLSELIGRISRPVTLVTTGPSALDYDWATLKKSGRLVVAVTGGAAFLRERGIVPDLLVVSDPDFCKANGHLVRDAAGVPLVIEYRCAAVLQAAFPDAFVGRCATIIERVNRWYGLPALPAADLKAANAGIGSPFVISEVPDKRERIGWSHRPDWGFYPSSTVACVALQVLVGLGATDIEIVGMDLGGKRSVYANALPSRLTEQYEAIILPSFQSMSEALKGKGVRIKNLSPTCPLPREIFELDAPPVPAQGTA